VGARGSHGGGVGGGGTAHTTGEGHAQTEDASPAFFFSEVADVWTLSNLS